MDLELCCKCNQPTGRAGQGEDSLYAGDFGPYCEDCWGDVPEELATSLTDIKDGLRRAESGNTVYEVLASYRSVRRAALG